jgi:mannose-1-phosphate guanylyltransferase/mannose-6-phosphate isomerase
LWPLSRRDFAKHHISILGGESPFQLTLRRLAAVAGSDTPIVIASQSGRFLAAEQAEEAGIEIELVLEPVGRDTLAAVTLGAVLAARRTPDATVLVLASDHLIPDVIAFAAAAAAAKAAAAEGDLVLFGIKPTGPASG